MTGFVAYDRAMGPLGEGFLADGLKQRAIHDRRLLAGQDLVLVFDLANIKVIAQQIVQRATAERDPATRSSRGELPGFGPNVAFSEVPSSSLTLPSSRYRRNIDLTSSASS